MTRLVVGIHEAKTTLSKLVKAAEAGTEVFVSSATAWEVAVKRANGKLDAHFDVAVAIARNYFIELPIEVSHALTAGELPRHHRDPFDRRLVAQAQIEDLALVTSDLEVAKYAVATLDAGA